MNEMYVLIYSKSPEKRISAFLLEKYLKVQGKKVACLTINTNRTFVFPYLKNDIYHYSIPVEAAKSRSEFEKWVPKGFDAYIFEVTFRYSPIGAAFVDLFETVNEIVSYKHKDTWEQVALDPTNYVTLFNKGKSIPDGQIIPNLTPMWNIIHNRNVTTVFTQCPIPVDGPYIDMTTTLNNGHMLSKVSINPQMEFLKSDKKIIAVGNFPAEYWDIYPNLKWYQYNYADFVEAFKSESHDLAVIGTCNTDSLKIQFKPKNSKAICYHPSAYTNLTIKEKGSTSDDDFHTVINTIVNQSIGTQISEKGSLSGFNNRYWVETKYNVSDPVWIEDNIVFCDGWITPQYLIRDNYLKVV
ncbi:hypothetical protein [uncultured Methanospirillum sp.]|uniref:hypothetical protein n=1 Tax=uncultured Methanospirillum sp. TaxID=262503 RepID=UPI0029C9874F|nr:hypothetical protein [uncultured Methanospirillum sp.]